MNRRVAAVAIFAVCALAGVSAQTAIDAAFAQFWAAPYTAEAQQRIDGIIRSGVAFDEAYRRLKRGRPYSSQPTGQVRLSNRAADGVEHPFVLNVPESYDPSRSYQVRFQLHGGVMMRTDNRILGPGTVGALVGADQIYIVPYAWDAAPWWSDDQLRNLVGILDTTKRLYNVDENRVVLSGVSDGATGAYYVAMRETTPFASFLPLNGFWMVLASDSLKVDGPLYGNNLRNKPLFIVNGGRDPLYPTDLVDPHIEQYRKHGVSLVYQPQPDAGHNTQWWPQVKDEFERFVRDHPRRPLPDTLTWETSDTTVHNRAHWLVIDTLGAASGEAKTLDDVNDVPISPRPDFGLQSIGGRVVRVTQASNADKIGFKVGDALVRLNDQTVSISTDILETLSAVKPGTEITLVVSRNNKPVELTGVYDPPIVSYPPRQLFDRPVPSGRVDLVRERNTIRAATRGVTAFTLLVSPDQFDFAKPIVVVANGRTVFSRRVQKDLGTLLKWASVDNDRTMLFAAEVHVDLRGVPAVGIR
jgi:pimeloyl-ACP methyl ester carboxylesterase